MAIKDFRWAMSFWCCQNNAAFHELLETSNRWLIKIFGGKLVLVVAPTPPFPHELLETTNRRLLRFWAGQGNFEELPANDTCWPAPYPIISCPFSVPPTCTRPDCLAATKINSRLLRFWGPVWRHALETKRAKHHRHVILLLDGY